MLRTTSHSRELNRFPAGCCCCFPRADPHPCLLPRPSSLTSLQLQQHPTEREETSSSGLATPTEPASVRTQANTRPTLTIETPRRSAPAPSPPTQSHSRSSSQELSRSWD